MTGPCGTLRAASGVLFVVGADMTSRHAAREAVQRLRTTGARFVGTVLNRADLGRNPYYFPLYRKE